jgi:undecaprenyl phosphate N,N'-diacetylbacillosamine 1-phosphate transferase
MILEVKMYRLYLKRIFDLFIAGLAFIFLLPVFVTISICLTFIYKGTPFFIQRRPGLHENIFNLIKFKTMTDERDNQGVLLADSLRLTPVGRFLRKTSLDELPQLLNVINGDMSLIGPRPLLPRYLPYYRGEERLRHNIRPGITGWAQVNGRNVSTWDNRLAADIYYFNNLSFKMDIKILYDTLTRVISARDVVTDPDSLMDPLDVERQKAVSRPAAN